MLAYLNSGLAEGWFDFDQQEIRVGRINAQAIKAVQLSSKAVTVRNYAGDIRFEHLFFIQGSNRGGHRWHGHVERGFSLPKRISQPLGEGAVADPEARQASPLAE